MISCKDCIDRFKSWGDDPRVKSGRYYLSGCDYCNKPQYYRDLELPKPEPLDKPDIKRLQYQVEQAKAGYLHLQNKLNEHLDKSKQPSQSAF